MLSPDTQVKNKKKIEKRNARTGRVRKRAIAVRKGSVGRWAQAKPSISLLKVGRELGQQRRQTAGTQPTVWTLNQEESPILL